MQDKPKDKPWLKRLRVMLPALVTPTILAFALSRVDLTAMGGAFSRLSIGTLAAAFAVVMAVNGAGALRWWFLIPNVRFFQVMVSYLCSRFFLLMPGGALVSDASRLMLIAGDTGGYQAAASTVLVDKLTSAIPMLGYCLVGMAISATPLPAAIWAAVIGVLSLELTLVAAAMSGALRPLVKGLSGFGRFRLGRVILDQLGSLSDACAGLRGQPRRFARHIAAGFVNDAGLVLISMIVGGALASGVRWSDWMYVSTLASLAMFLPVSVSGIGLREGAYVAVLSILSVEAPVALAISLVISGLNMVNNLLCGGLYLIFRGRAGINQKEKRT